MRLTRVIILCLLACAPLGARQHSPQTYTIQLPPPPDFHGLGWLIGNWSGKTVGAKPAGKVALSVSYALDRRFLVVHESVFLPATKSAPATKEDLLGVLSANPAGGGYALDLYSSSGFVTHYQATVKLAEIDFNPAGGRVAPQGWLFRRVVIHTNPGECTETVSAAPPGQTFFNYYIADLHRIPSAGEIQHTAVPPNDAAGQKHPAKPGAPHANENYKL